MSQSLRERIEGLRPVVSWGPAEEEHDLIDKTDVLRIIAEHEREQAAVAIGVQPVKEPQAVRGDINPQCNFCDKRRREVVKMFRRNEVHICNECVSFCLELLAEEMNAYIESNPTQ